MKISLFCSFGMSTGVLVSRMKPCGAPQDVIEAYDINSVEAIAPQSDVVLLGPQARIHLGRVKKLCDSLGVPCAVIDMVAYGRGDGAAVYAMARSMVEARKDI